MVTTDGESSGVVHFGFLGANGGNDAAIGHLVIFGSLFFGYEEGGVPAHWHAVASTLGKLAQFIGKQMNPCVLAGWRFD